MKGANTIKELLISQEIRQKIQNFCFISILFLIQNIALAENINIIIKQMGTGDLVDGATVVIGDGENYQTTNSRGKVFFTDVSEPVEIKILAQGYEKYSKIFKKVENKMTLYIYPISLEGEGMVVTANRIIEKGSKFTLSKQDLLTSAGSMGDPLKAISALPGVISADSGSAKVYMRGSNLNENIVWINRAPVSYLYHFGGFQSVINPALIEDMNVFLAGFPVEYGDALGGAIDVKLRAPKNDRMHSRYDISLISASFLVEGPVSEDSDDSFFISGRRSYFDLILSPDNSENSEEDQITRVPRFYDVQGLYRHVLKKGYIDTFFFAAADGFEEDIRESAKSDPQFAGLFGIEQAFQTIGSTWQESWNDKWDSTTTLSFTIDKTRISLGRDTTGQPFFADLESNKIFWQPELNWRRTQSDRFIFGLELSYDKAPLDLSISRFPREEDAFFDLTSQKKNRIKTNLFTKNYSHYLKYRKQWTKDFVTTLGLRYSNINVTGGFQAQEISPRVSLEYNTSKDTLLTATWGRYIQTPDVLEVIEKFGNPGLKVTKAEHRVLGIQHNFDSLYSIKTEIYHKPLKDLVVTIDENDPPANFASAGVGKAYGVDIFLKREARDNVRGWLALSWAESRRTNELTNLTRTFSGDQPVTLTAVWGQPFGGDWKRWNWSIKAQVRSGKPYTKVTGRHLENPDDPNSRYIPELGKNNGERLPTYFRVDLRIEREVLSKNSKMTWYLDIQNASLRKNIEEFDYGNEYERVDNPKEVTDIGFFPFFGIKYEF